MVHSRSFSATRMNALSRRRPPIVEIIALTAFVCGLASAVTSWWLRGSLWEDEIIAVSHGLQPLPSFFIEVLRNDIHPFLYFLFLKTWSSIAFGSDKWVLASSLAAAVFSISVLATIAYKVGGRVAAIWAATLFCVLPSFSWSASNLRMYSLMPAIAVGCWYANRQALRYGGVRWLLVMILLQIAESYLHAIGFFFASFFALAALVGQRDVITQQHFRHWVGAQTLSLLFMLPVIASALIRGTEPLGDPTLWSILGYSVQLISFLAPAPWVPIASGVTIFALVAFASLDKEARVLALVIPCGALLACTLAGVMGKPMFKAPVFTANLTPFLALGAGLGIARHKAAQPLAAFCGMVLAVDLWSGQLERHLAQNYQPAAYYVAENVRSGDQVVIPSMSVFWGVLRYGVAPNWGAPLAILPLTDNPQWTALKVQMGPRLVTLLGLKPMTDHIDKDGVRYTIGTEISSDTVPCGRLWVVHRNNYARRGQEEITFPPGMHQDSVVPFGDELTVSLMTATACDAAPRRATNKTDQPSDNSPL